MKDITAKRIKPINVRMHSRGDLEVKRQARGFWICRAGRISTDFPGDTDGMAPTAVPDDNNKGVGRPTLSRKG